MRIVAVVTNRFKSLPYKIAPEWINDNKEMKYGVSPSIENLDISTQNIFHHYGNPPAIIDCFFKNETRIEVYIGEDAEIFAIIYDETGKVVLNKRSANKVNIPLINILPHISPLLQEEKIIKQQTVQSNLLTKLSSRNFRNQIMYYNEDFHKFRELAEESWKGLSINNIDNLNGFHGEKINLMVRDGIFPAEIGWMGHGLQMWLQTMWFLARSSEDSSVILDEPDVYMHADLQRKLIRLIKNRYKQVIIATHSVEIMSEVEAENILPIDCRKSKIVYANKPLLVQKVIEDIGSVHNLEIVRLFSSKKFLIVEGDNDDIKMLGIFQSILYPNSNDPLDIIPKTFVEGWGGWQRVIGASKVFNDSEIGVKTYCIFDSDYHTEEEKIDRRKEAQRNNINLHIWNRKEIENYLLNAKVISRFIDKKKRKGKISSDIVLKKITEIAEDLKQDIYDDYATEIKSKFPDLVVKTANQKAREYVDSRWQNFIILLPGKKVISCLSAWSQAEYKVNINKFNLAREFTINEICSEMREIIDVMERNDNFYFP
ncbi:MAG: AAA family ATPase, partial [Dysgonomonas sp.]|nr:AAA family ATPase [Dysgonomonas sp.]